MLTFLFVLLILPVLSGCLAEPEEGKGIINHGHCIARYHSDGDCGTEKTRDNRLLFFVNSSEEDIVINSGQTVSVNWEAGSNLYDCEVDPGNYSGNEGSFNSDPITETVTFRASCQGTEETFEKSIRVLIRPVVPAGPAIVTFRIPDTISATSDPWNTPGTAVSVKVNDTLRVYNDSNVSVRIHTGGRPFPHASMNIPTGEFRDYNIQQECTATPCPGIYNHNGPANQGSFYINVAP